MPEATTRPAARPFASDESVAAIAHGLLDRTLPKSMWTHEAHFAAAIWLLLHRPDLDLTRTLPDVIRSYNVATGGVNTETEGYHETITQASLGAARLYAGATPRHAGPPSACQVTNMLLASRYGRPDWLLHHWSRDCLFSVIARRQWVPPDVRDLPWAAGLGGEACRVARLCAE